MRKSQGPNSANPEDMVSISRSRRQYMRREDSHWVVKQRLPHRLEVPCDVQRCHGTIYDVPLVQRPTRLARRVEGRIHDNDARTNRDDDVFVTVKDSDVFEDKQSSSPSAICMGGEVNQKRRVITFPFQLASAIMIVFSPS